MNKLSFNFKCNKEKNIAIRTSFIQCKIDNLRPKLFSPIKIYLSNVSKYNDDIEELLIISAKIALTNKINPLAASNLKNHLKGDAKYFNIFYFIKSSVKSFISIIDWYKLSNNKFISGNISDICASNVSKISMSATVDKSITKKTFK